MNHFQLNEHSPLAFRHDALGRETVRESANGFILASRYTATGLLAHQSAGQATPFFRETLAQNDPHFPPQASAINRSWQYDRAHNVRVIDDSRWGQTRYHYNANDQILHTLFEGTRPHEEQFSYDANGNLNQHLPVDARGTLTQLEQHQKAGRVVQQGDIRYRYDDNGRLVEKTEQRDGFRPQIWRYRWDTQNQLIHSETPDGSRWHYRYDAFGRRVRKLKVHDGKLTAANLQLWLAGKPDLAPRSDATMGQDYLWSGDQLIEEVPVYADGTPVEDKRIRWLYEPGSLTPSARFEKGKLHYIVSDHQGTPREMLSEEGVLVWAQRLTTWGKAEKSQVIASNNPDFHVGCNFRFCGQYADEESGLFYNRFRYYSPETAQYISPDPIGLLGGVNPYGYVHNPSKWIDPYGLAGGIGNKGDYIITYRGDTRSFTEIFDKGFETLGPSKDLYKHALDNRAPPSDFVSTTIDPTKTISFATKYGQKSGYMYTMKTNHGIDVNKALGARSPFAAEAEIAMPRGVRAEDILGARAVNADGEMWDYTILNPKRYGK
ncbi:RHS repeat-associated core domain-containing protein [Xenorhabdus bovienii]|uniref:RHS repeat-associated core domain-containing protein n=1 Tax=Xenorhabdus bovienii TaxID=40576 RepID=UPI0023B29522|nr:RHS repeat-associated core domain-containing protein [Xenorhabdus bovienii]